MPWTPRTLLPRRSVQFLVCGLEALGHARSGLAAHIGEPVDEWGPEHTLTVAQCVALLDHALATEGPDVGLRAGLAIPPGALGLVDHLTAAAPTARAALADLCRYFGLVASGVALTLRGDVLTLGMPAFDTRYQRLFGESTFALITSRLSARSARPFLECGRERGLRTGLSGRAAENLRSGFGPLLPLTRATGPTPSLDSCHARCMSRGRRRVITTD